MSKKVKNCQKSCPVVPLCRDKGRSKNPVTKSPVPGRPRTKSLPHCQKKMSKKVKNCQNCFFSKNAIFSLFSICPVSHPGTGQDRRSKSRHGLSHSKTWKSCSVLARLVAKCQNPLPAHPLARRWACPFVPGKWRIFCPFVPQDKTVLSRWKP